MNQSLVTRPSFDDFYQKNKGLVCKVARKVHRRALAMNAGLEYEDLEQEAALVMMRAYDKFDPNLGFQFSTYFFRAAYNELGRCLKPFENDINVLGLSSMQAAVGDDGESIDMESMIDGGHASPEQLMEGSDLIKSIQKKLSPLARMILDLMIDPPDEVEKEWQSLRAAGLETWTNMTKNYLSSYVEKLTGASNIEIRMAMSEIDRVGKDFCK
jgi:RNA polymerase sigma factor (sigma-70 family)